MSCQYAAPSAGLLIKIAIKFLNSINVVHKVKRKSIVLELEKEIQRVTLHCCNSFLKHLPLLNRTNGKLLCTKKYLLQKKKVYSENLMPASSPRPKATRAVTPFSVYLCFLDVLTASPRLPSPCVL